MTTPNGGPVKGAVLLGGRQYQLTVSRPQDARLKLLAEVNRCSPHDMANFLLDTGIEQGFSQFIVAKLFAHLSQWMAWCRMEER